MKEWAKKRINEWVGKHDTLLYTLKVFVFYTKMNLEKICSKTPAVI